MNRTKLRLLPAKASNIPRQLPDMLLYAPKGPPCPVMHARVICSPKLIASRNCVNAPPADFGGKIANSTKRYFFIVYVLRPSTSSAFCRGLGLQQTFIRWRQGSSLD